MLLVLISGLRTTGEVVIGWMDIVQILLKS